MNWTEVLGFVTGALCVWLTTRQNVWNWPIGIANNIFFIVLFFEAGLYADTGLQVVYIVLGVLGWYWWLRGGPQRSTLQVSHLPVRTAMLLVPITALGTLGMMQALTWANGSAPFMDAFTTVLSLVAQYLLTRKYLENWYVWIVADVLYIGLYISRDLHLTAVLFAVFLVLCISGLLQWRRSLAQQHQSAAVAVAAGG